MAQLRRGLLWPAPQQAPRSSGPVHSCPLFRLLARSMGNAALSHPARRTREQGVLLSWQRAVRMTARGRGKGPRQRRSVARLSDGRIDGRASERTRA